MYLANLIYFGIQSLQIITLQHPKQTHYYAFTIGIMGFGFFAVTQIPIGAIPDITNNQEQVITSHGLSNFLKERF